MSALVAEDAVLFEDFRLDRRGGGLCQRDERGDFVPVPLGSRALDVLCALVASAGELVSRDQIIAAVWPATVVEDNNLNMQIAALRRVLDQGRAQSCIQTIPGRGYRFVAAGDPLRQRTRNPRANSPNRQRLACRRLYGANGVRGLEAPGSRRRAPARVAARPAAGLSRRDRGYRCHIYACGGTRDRRTAFIMVRQRNSGPAAVDRRAALCRPQPRS